MNWLKRIIASIKDYRSGPSVNFDPPAPDPEQAAKEAKEFVEDGYKPKPPKKIISG